MINMTGGCINPIFADVIAPFTFEKQSLLNANAVPTWITNLFPSLKPYAVINEDYPIGADKLGRDLFSGAGRAGERAPVRLRRGPHGDP